MAPLTPEPFAEKWLQTCVLHLGGGGARSTPPVLAWDGRSPGPQSRSRCAGPQPAPVHFLDFAPRFTQGSPLSDLPGQKVWQGRRR